MYLRNAVAAVIVYDITERESFQEIKKWVNGEFISSQCLFKILLMGTMGQIFVLRSLN